MIIGLKNMTENNEVNLDTLSPIAKQALENLAKEGHTPAPKDAIVQENEDGEIKDPAPAPKEEKKPDVIPPKEEKPKEEKPADAIIPKDEKKPRDVKFVEAYKLKIAESQKEATEKKLAEATAEIERLSKKSDLTPKDKEVLNDSINDLTAKYPDIDPNLLKDLQDSILKKVVAPKEVQEALKELATIKAERNESLEAIEYSKDFEKDVMPLIKAEHPNLSDEALLQIKDSLKVFAYSEEYAKVSLSKIYKAEKESLNIPVSVPKKKSSENGSSFKTRDSGAVDFDSMTEEGFKNLTNEEKIAFSEHQRKGGSRWK